MPLAVRVVRYLVAHELTPERFRRRLLGRAGIHADPSAIVFPGVELAGEAGVSIGALSFVNRGCVFDAAAPIDIRTKVAVGNRCMFLTSHHDFSDPAQRGGGRTLLPIAISDGAWIGAGATILGGVTVGAGAVIAAGAVVIRDCDPHTLYGGVPARKIRAL